MRSRDPKPLRVAAWAAFAVAVTLGGAGCGQDKSAAAMPPAAGPGSPPRADLPTIPAPGDIAQVTAKTGETTGTTFPIRSAAVGPNMSGVIAKLPVEEGDAVKKGTLLFRLRTQDMSLRVRQAKTGIKAAKVRLSAVDVEYQRTKRLFEKRAIDQAAWDRVQAEYEGASAGVEAAEAMLALANKALADTTVRSPIDGVVTHKLKNIGEMVTMMPPTVVVVVEDHSVLELRFSLPERALATLKVGDAVEANFTAIGVERAAEVTRISPSVDVRTRTVEVIAELDNADGSLKSGMLAAVKMGGAGVAGTKR